MPLIKMTSRSPKTVDRNDVVVHTAIALGVTPEEVFRRAYIKAGNSGSEAENIFRNRYYPAAGFKPFNIPLVVREFCEAGLPSCDVCGATEPKDSRKMFSKTIDQQTSYFCSLVCMNDTSESKRGRPKEEGDAEGKAIFDRISRAIAGAELVTVPEDEIRFMENQPRKYFDQARLQSLAESMLRFRSKSKDANATGQMMPGYIRGVQDLEGKIKYELLDGERRLRAVRIAGIRVYRALKIDLDDEGARHVVSIISNFNREGHTPLEIADAVCHLHEELGFTFQEIADVIDRHYNQVLDFYRMRLLRPEVRDLLDPDKTPKKQMLTQGAAMEISKLERGRQLSYAKKSIEDGLRISDLKQEVREHRQYTNGSGTRAISPSERRTSLTKAVKRFPTTVKALRTSAQLAESSGAIETIPEDEKSELVAVLKECETMLQETLQLVSQ